ncbi:bifunctional diguanylate cyclase/phosphodiesterase [Agrobacterium sp. rho-13.3]|uniref:bifunctional diguanylate cyclase/phosphodiesterase n=1 Tax=Agrobacterium sp. rho-13.3 TaxID=3072980 RepID=UPI002A1400B0|nr:EAL domain-containing protein [Agrobacterium sp. rho-13.3]MDX8306718.1 EAL domain-containing protein [Agrobacterium sp. rho-13.3]MDX8306951.1 EAL domain-containing protein [Agrobacterium sp. rho-13.3]
MFAVLECVAVQHDRRIVILAALIALLGMLSFYHLLLRADESPLKRRPTWVLVAAFASGLSVWATHFIAMLAYQGSVPIGFDFPFTGLSAVVAVLGFWVSLQFLWDKKAAAVLSGVTITLTVGAMHFIGMTGMQVAARIDYHITPILVGTAVAAVLFTLSFVAFKHLRGWQQVVVSASASILGILALHFTAMSSTILIPDPTMHGPDIDGFDRLVLMAAISGVTFVVLAITGAAALIDRYLVDLKGLVGATLDGMAVVREGRIVEVNARFAQLFDASEASLIGENADDLMHADDGIPAHVARAVGVEAVPNRGDRSRTFELAVRTIEYRGRPCEVMAVRDLTEKRRAQREVEYLARHDVLTGLANRTLFQERLKNHITIAQNDDQFALLALDLDRFKAVNDLFGHAEGDRVLRAVARILQRASREGDLVGRLGGDEFVILTAFGTTSDEARTLGEHILSTFRREMDYVSDPTAVGVTIGIATFPANGDDSETLMHAADMALYRAKINGRGIVAFYDAAMDLETRERRRLESDLRQAISRNELELLYQPVHSVENGEVAGYEALVRWQHPTRGMVPPDVFIPIAEESGIIITLGEWILHEACSTAVGWPPHIKVAVNVSPVQFSLANLAYTICNTLEKTGLAPSRLELEMTEAALLKDRAVTLATMRQLKELGITIVMDDFGTGYSSLSNLRSFPFDKIKIDRSFIAAMKQDENAHAIVRAIIGLGRSLDLPVTAEGIETDSQYRMVVDEGCAQAQGYLFGKPGKVPARSRRADKAVLS